jgi:superfamily II DNA/RNA helicase
MAARRLHSSPETTPAEPDAPTFDELGVPAELVAALAARGIDRPFPIQAVTLPDSLAGRDVLGRGRTGSGKTYAFVLPVLARLAAQPRRAQPGRPRALILAPTRELATQIEAAMAPLAAALRLRTTTVFGGVPHARQIRALQKAVDVLVACPGRLADHIGAGRVWLDAVEVTVLDEADHMADLGFLPAVRRLLDQTPPDGQRMLFSATLDGDVDVLVRRYLSHPVTHSVDAAESPVPDMTHHVLHVRPDGRLPVLVELTSAPGRTLVFTRTKRGASRRARQLVDSGVRAVELHGNLAQSARTRNLAAFAGGDASTLVATDIAARGIHVDDVALVIHADPPVEPKSYLHRSGRTARAGAQGTVVTLMTDGQVGDVRDLTRKAGIRPTTTRLAPGDALLAEIAPGARLLHAPPAPETPNSLAASGRRRDAAARRNHAGGTAHRRGDAARPHDDAAHPRSGRGRSRGDAGHPRDAGRSRERSTSDAAHSGGDASTRSAQRGHRGGADRAKPAANASTGSGRGGTASAFSASSRIGRRGR